MTNAHHSGHPRMSRPAARRSELTLIPGVSAVGEVVVAGATDSDVGTGILDVGEAEAVAARVVYARILFISK